jgi:hypothetical protein
MDRQRTTDSIRIFKFGFSCPVQAPYVNHSHIVLSKYQKDANSIKKDKYEQRRLMKFFFLQGKRYKAICGELRAILGEVAVSLASAKPWCQRFSALDFSLDDDNKPGRPLSDRAPIISQLLLNEPFLSACVLPSRFATSPHTIKETSALDLGMRKFTRRWMPHELTPANKAQRVEDAQTPLPAPGSDSEKHFAHIMTGDESGSTLALNRRECLDTGDVK